MQHHRLAAALLACLAANAFGIAVRPVAHAPKDSSHAPAAAPKAPGPARAPSAGDVAALHSKMEHVAASVEGMLKPGKGSLAEAKVAPALKAFVAELRATLKETAGPKEADLPKAMAKLTAARAGMAEMTEAIGRQQEALMREGRDEETSLLLGVLMGKKGAPFAEQWEVLENNDFKDLPVVNTLLAKHDETKPLFQQVAEYADVHTKAMKPAAAKLVATVAYFQKRVDTLEREQARMKKVYDSAMQKYDEITKKSPKADVHQLQLMKRRAHRDMKKRRAAGKASLAMMRNIVAALRRGDMDALKKAQEALKESMKSMERQTGHFLHLLQIGHRMQGRECPYCAAQCIEKCHDGGNPYAKCLSNCAEAGK